MRVLFVCAEGDYIIGGYSGRKRDQNPKLGKYGKIQEKRRRV